MNSEKDNEVSKRRKKILGVFLYILAIFLFQEAALRMCFPLPEYKNLDRVNYLTWHPEYDGSKHLRDQDWFWVSYLDTSAKFEHEMNFGPACASKPAGSVVSSN